MVPVVVVAAAGFAGYYAVRSVNWAVMTDELQVVRLATSIADSLSPVPQIHGVYYGALSQLYPLLLAPFFGLLDAPTAVRAGHVFNALLLPSAAVPAFLMARSVAGSRVAGYVAAALTVFTPWLVLTSTLLTENAAYPAFVWAVYLCHRTLARPSSTADALALAGLAVAFLARTQLAILALAFPLVVVCHEVVFAAVTAHRLRRGALATGIRKAVASHLLLAVAYAVGAFAAGALAVAGSLGTVVGNYSVSLDGALFPPGIWKSAAEHLDYVVVGVGILPFLLSSAWALLAVVRAERKEAHAFAVTFVILVPLLTFEVASFDLRFTPQAFVQDRYLFYLAPLFAVGSSAMLVERTRPFIRITLVAVVGFLFAWLVAFAAYGEDKVLFWAAPAAAFHPALEDAAGWVSLSPAWLLRCVTAVLVLVVVALLACAPRAALWMTAVVAAFGAFEAAYVFGYSDAVLTRDSTPIGFARNWIDEAVDGDNSVALVPSPHDGPTSWWDAEYWNTKVTRLLRVDGGNTYSPFPSDDVSVDYARGTIRGPQPSDFLLVSPRETRFQLHAKTIIDAKSLKLMRAQRPYPLTWATRGLTPDGWKPSGTPLKVRVYGSAAGGRRRLVLTMSSSSHAALPLKFTFETRSASRRGSVDPGGARPPISLPMCVPPGGHAEATLRATGAVRIPDGRLVSVHVERIQVEPQPGGCAR